ncbi:MAG TPA: hypothetical protein VMV10_03710 [Pirellulales bacterium]|nr:hypothetical protein [Pirellulales bacterium]
MTDEQKNSLSLQDFMPQRTAEEGDRLASEFKQVLYARSVQNARHRGSLTVTESDVQQAFRSLLTEPKSAKIRRAVGDAFLIFGGAMFSLPFGADYPWLLAVSGVALVGAGLFVREWTE